MSKMTVFLCDNCQSEDASRVKISVGSTQLTADLCIECTEGLVEAIKDKVPGAIELKKSSSNADPKAIRAWATERGLLSATRGRISADIRTAYDDFMARENSDSQSEGDE